LPLSRLVVTLPRRSTATSTAHACRVRLCSKLPCFCHLPHLLHHALGGRTQRRSPNTSSTFLADQRRAMPRRHFASATGFFRRVRIARPTGLPGIGCLARMADITRLDNVVSSIPTGLLSHPTRAPLHARAMPYASPFCSRIPRLPYSLPASFLRLARYLSGWEAGDWAEEEPRAWTSSTCTNCLRRTLPSCIPARQRTSCYCNQHFIRWTFWAFGHLLWVSWFEQAGWVLPSSPVADSTLSLNIREILQW